MKAVRVKQVEIGSGIPKICVPIVEKTSDEIKAAAEQIVKLPADLVEWRADWYEDWQDAAAVLKLLVELQRILKGKPLLFTLRTKAEGGEAKVTEDVYFELILRVARVGSADLLDVEYFRGERTGEMIREAKLAGKKVISSSHDFQKTPDAEELLSRLADMEEEGADLVKVAVMPKNKKDVLELLEVTRKASEGTIQVPCITMAMGSLGVGTRILGETFGSAVTFGTMGKASAPGQLEVKELKQILDTLHCIS